MTAASRHATAAAGAPCTHHLQVGGQAREQLPHVLAGLAAHLEQVKEQVKVLLVVGQQRARVVLQALAVVGRARHGLLGSECEALTARAKWSASGAPQGSSGAHMQLVEMRDAQFLHGALVALLLVEDAVEVLEDQPVARVLQQLLHARADRTQLQRPAGRVRHRHRGNRVAAAPRRAPAWSARS
jgi:hypothetical protein